jgi:hypothetical protein
MMTQGNIGSLKKEEGHVFTICTRHTDAVYFENQASINRLGDFVDVKFMLMDGLVDFDSPHVAMSGCYARAMAAPEVVPGQTYFVFLTPDSFWTENTVRRLGVLADEGYAVVMAMGLRTTRETIEPVLQGVIAEHPDNPAIPVEKGVSLALAHLHRMSRAHDWFSPDGISTGWPSHLYWIVGSDRFFARCFHLHPVMVRSKDDVAAIGDTIDGQFLNRLGYPQTKYYVARGNADFLAVEMSPADREQNAVLGQPSVKAILTFGRKFANPQHWYFFSHHMDYHGEGVDPSLPNRYYDIGNYIDEIVAAVEKRKRLNLFLAHMIHSPAGRSFIKYVFFPVKRILKIVLRNRFVGALRAGAGKAV